MSLDSIGSVGFIPATSYIIASGDRVEEQKFGSALVSLWDVGTEIRRPGSSKRPKMSGLSLAFVLGTAMRRFSSSSAASLIWARLLMTTGLSVGERRLSR